MQQLSFEEMHCAEVANPGEITGLAFNAASNHLAVCNQNSVVQMFTIDATMTPHIIFSIPISNYILDIILFLCCTYQFYQKSEPFFVAAVCWVVTAAVTCDTLQVLNVITWRYDFSLHDVYIVQTLRSVSLCMLFMVCSCCLWSSVVTMAQTWNLKVYCTRLPLYFRRWEGMMMT